MDERILERARQAIEEKVFPGCVIGTIISGKREVLPLGKLRYDGADPVREDTMYDVASVTKSIPVASLAALLIEAGKMKLTARARDYLPELQNDFEATVEDLLMYRVRGTQLSTLAFLTFEQIRTYIFEHGFEGPASAAVYSNVPAYLLGVILERVSGMLLPELAHKHLFEPLAMNDTTFFVHDIERVAPTELVDGKEIRGIVHDESARVFSRARRAVGHAGLFSTAPDLLNFLEALLNVGPTRSYMSAVLQAAQNGLGWEVNKEWMGKHRGKSMFGKTGFTGTSVLVDIDRKIGLVILSNRTYPTRPTDNSAINAFRSQIADLVFSD